MFGFRTPVKGAKSIDDISPNPKMTQDLPIDPKPGPSVRRSIGEWESGKSDTIPKTQNSTKSTTPVETQRPKPKGTLSQESRAPARRTSTETTGGSPRLESKQGDRLAEARACVTRAKLHLGNSRNTKTEIKNEVTQAIDRLYQLVKEAESVKGKGQKKASDPGKQQENEPPKAEERTNERDREGEKRRTERIEKEDEIIRKIVEHGKLLEDHRKEMEKLTETIKTQQESHTNRGSYASVTAGSPKQPLENTAMHSIIISSKDEQETGDQVFERIRKVVNATEEGTKIDKIRKAKDRKIIVGCQNEEELKKVKKRIAEREGQLNIEDIKNKDPLVILYGVLQCHTDEDIIKAIRTQNGHLLRGVSGEDDRMEVRFRRKARNPLISHVVIKVSPRLWQCLTSAGTVYIDMQRIRVADQSPLVQCSRCLGYGHGRRFCTEAVDVCSHCGGAHLKPECPDWLSDATPCCVNCIKTKAAKTDHGAFSNECPVRRKWEALARSTVAYC